VDPKLVERIKQNPKYQELVRKRSSFAKILTIAMLLLYFGFIALVALNNPLLATPIGAGVTTIGIPLGVFVIVSAFLLTGIYVRRANSEFDDLTKDIVEEVKK